MDAIAIRLGAWPRIERWPVDCSVTAVANPANDPDDFRRWRHVADFVLFGVEGATPNVHHDVAAVAVELMSNAVRHASGPRELQQLTISRHRRTICVESRNAALPGAIFELREVFEDLIVADPVELMCRQLERTAAHDPQHSGIGLLALSADFGIALGARIEELDDEHALVRVRAILNCVGGGADGSST